MNPCPHCGAEPLPSARFCVACGTPLSGAVSTDRLRDPRRPAWVAAGLFAVLLTVEFASVVLHASRSLEARRYARGDVMSGGQIDILGHWERAVGGLTALLLLASGIAIIVWLRRCYHNARALTGATQLATAWAIWGWIVPVVSLVMPLLVVRDAFARSRRFDEAAAPVPAAVGWWWGLVIGSMVAGVAADSTWPVIRSVVDLEHLEAAWAGVGLLRIAAGLVGIAIGAELTRRQRRLLAAVREDQALRATSRTA